MGFHAVVLLKQIPDPELPASRFKIDPQTKRPATGSVPEVVGPFERSALEVAVQLKDAGGVERITALIAGGKGADDALRKAMAVGADEAVRVNVEGLGELDPQQTARLLTAAIKKIGNVDLILAGRQAGDWDHGQVGYLVAEQLGYPCVAFVQNGEVRDGQLRVRRAARGGREVLSVSLPAVLTITNDDSNVLRMARVQDLMKARRRPITEWSVADLGIDPAELEAARAADIVDVWVPEEKAECEFIKGDDPQATAAALVKRMRELQLI